MNLNVIEAEDGEEALGIIKNIEVEISLVLTD